MYRTTTRKAASYRQTTGLRSLIGKQSSNIRVEAVAAAFDLTPAEIRTFGRLLGGSSPAEIADELGVALPTVRTHLSNIFAKTGTARQLDLVLLAVQFTTPNLGPKKAVEASWPLASRVIFRTKGRINKTGMSAFGGRAGHALFAQQMSAIGP